ncbi:Major facilitator superfamily domain-containing protein 4-B [Oryzias melastigma]|uniref:Major facilitator superfamily domain-containing protein 4-B n=1 Tax=Oryzias melastigma TaxID=30732 RepID=A0A834C7E0_ORYME|nr:Major facilitator superfamily domain-containing protein 4-B [Oryzias melastigma]
MFMDERIVTLFKRNAHHTLTYWSLFFSFGLCIAFLGPTILDLQSQTNSTLSQITWVFFAQQFCLLIGSSIGGVFRKTLLSALAALFISALIISVIFAIIPLCHNVLVLAIALAVSGLAMGVIDTIANIQLVTIYQKDSAVFLQALHFFIGFGALVSPLIADPFLSEILFLMYREQLIPCCPGGTPRLLDKDELAMENQQEAEGPNSEQTEHDVGGHGSIFSCCQNDSMRGMPVSFFMIHILGGMVLFMTDGIVVSKRALTLALCTRTPWLHQCRCPIRRQVTWRAYSGQAITAGRLLSIPLSYRFQPVRLLMFNLAGAIVTVLMLLIFYTSRVFLFVGTCLCGLFLSSIFPCMLAYTEDILDYQGSYSFLLCGMIIACIGFILFIGLLLFQRMHRNYLTGTSKKSAMVEEPDTSEQNGTAKTEQTENKESS